MVARTDPESHFDFECLCSVPQFLSENIRGCCCVSSGRPLCVAGRVQDEAAKGRVLSKKHFKKCIFKIVNKRTILKKSRDNTQKTFFVFVFFPKSWRFSRSFWSASIRHGLANRNNIIPITFTSFYSGNCTVHGHTSFYSSPAATLSETSLLHCPQVFYHYALFFTHKTHGEWWSISSMHHRWTTTQTNRVANPSHSMHATHSRTLSRS